MHKGPFSDRQLARHAALLSLIKDVMLRKPPGLQALPATSEVSSATRRMDPPAICNMLHDLRVPLKSRAKMSSWRACQRKVEMSYSLQSRNVLRSEEHTSELQ